MANPEHLEILKQGVEQWNKWRNEHPDVTPDLNEANLHGARPHVAWTSAGKPQRSEPRLANLGGARLPGCRSQRGGSDRGGPRRSEPPRGEPSRGGPRR